MTLDDFRQSLAATEPPAGLTHALAGLWWDAKGQTKRYIACTRPKPNEECSIQSFALQSMSLPSFQTDTGEYTLLSSGNVPSCCI
jgi:hypothetical protein